MLTLKSKCGSNDLKIAVFYGNAGFRPWICPIILVSDPGSGVGSGAPASVQSSLARPWSWPWVRPWTFTAHVSPSEGMSCPASLASRRTACGADQARCAVPCRSFRLSSLPLHWPQGQLACGVCPSTAKMLTISQCVSPYRELS